MEFCNISLDSSLLLRALTFTCEGELIASERGGKTS